MNEYSFNEIQIGMKEQFTVSVTEEMMDMFKKLSGDENPLHQDSQFALEQGFDDRVVYGILTSSFISQLVGVFIPGKYCLLKQIEVKFLKPVYVGDCLVVSGEVIDRNDTVEQIELAVSIINQDGIKVVKGKIKTGITKRKEIVS